MASTDSGLSENYVLQEYGRDGHKKFMKLAAKGYLINKNGNFFIPGVDIHLDEFTCYKVGQNLLKDLTQDLLIKGQLNNTDYRLEYRNVDFSKIKPKVTSLISDFNFELNKLLKDQNNKGDDTFVSSQLYMLLNNQ